MPDPLDAIMEWYQSVQDCIRVTQRVIRGNISGAITDRHIFYNKSAEESLLSLDGAKKELDRLAVLGLAAVFERTLREFLKESTLSNFSIIDPHGAIDEHKAAVKGRIIRDIENWRFSDDLLKAFPSVDKNTRGSVAQIVDYRNWVAHGHTISAPPPSQINPRSAYARLTEFLRQAGVLMDQPPPDPPE